MNSTETQEMDRDDEEDVVIYANADFIINNDGRTRVEDSDTKIILQNTGADSSHYVKKYLHKERHFRKTFLSCLLFLGSVSSRMYGATAVYSVLLCVLLTLIIVLCVQLTTHYSETHYCQTEIKNFTDEFQNMYKDLMKEINQLQKETNKRDQILIENINN